MGRSITCCGDWDKVGTVIEVEGNYVSLLS